MAAREARCNGIPVGLRIVSSMEALASLEKNAPGSGANLFYRVFVMRCKGTGYPRPAARETSQDSHYSEFGAAADHRDGDVLLRSECIGLEPRSTHLYRSLGQPVESLGPITLCSVALPAAIQVRKT